MLLVGEKYQYIQTMCIILWMVHWVRKNRIGRAINYNIVPLIPSDYCAWTEWQTCAFVLSRPLVVLFFRIIPRRSRSHSMRILGRENQLQHGINGGERKDPSLGKCAQIIKGSRPYFIRRREVRREWLECHNRDREGSMGYLGLRENKYRKGRNC